MTQTATLELLTKEYFWNIGSSKTLKTMVALDAVTIGNTDNKDTYTHITTSNVTSNLFIGNLDGQVGTLSVNGNMSGSVLITGDGTNAATMNLELELEPVNSGNVGTYGSQTQIPSFNVDKYGRVSQVSNVTISTTLNLLDTTGDTGAVDLLNGNLRIKGTSNQIVSEVTGNTFTLSLDNDVNMENLSLSGNLHVTKATSLYSTLAVGGASTLESTLDAVGAASLHSTLAVGGAATLESTLDVVNASSLHGILAVGGASTLESTLDVVNASSLHSTLAVGGASTLESTLDAVGAASLHSTLAVGGSTTLNSSLYVSGTSTYLDNILARKDVTVQGNIYVRGNLAQVDAETIVLSDPLIVLGNSNMSGAYQDLGFQFIKDSNADNYGYFGWVGLSNEFQFYETADIDGNDLITGNSTLGTVRAEAFKANVVEATSFVGPLQGSALNFENSLTLDFCGNVLGSVTFFGNEVSLDVPLELQSVAANIGSFGNSISVPTISVDTYGRVTAVSENSISTTLSLLDTNGDTGIVDLLNGDLKINGTSRKVDSDVVGNTFTLTLPDNLLVVDVSMTGMLQVDGATTLESTLDAVGAASLHSTLAVGGAATLESTLDAVGAASLHSTLAVGGAATLESTLDVVNASSLHSTLAVGGASTLESTLDVVNASSLHSTLAVGGASTLESTLDAVGAASLHSTLAVGGAATLESTLDVVNASSLHGNLAVGGAAILKDTLDVVKASSLHSTLTVGGAALLKDTLDVVKASSLHSALQVGGAATLETTLDVVNASSLHSSLAVGGASTLESTLDVVNASSLHSTLAVGGDATFNKNLVIQGNLTVHGTETKIDTITLTIEDNKIELNSDGNIEPFGIYANIIDHGGDISLYYEVGSSRWEFNRDLYVSGNLTVSDSATISDTLFVVNAATLEESLDVVKASSLHSTLAVGGAATLEDRLDVVNASSLHSTLQVGGAATLESTLEVVSSITTPNYIIKDNVSSNTIALVAPDLSSGSYTLTLPETDGITNQFLQTDGSGTLSWVTPDTSQQMFGQQITSGDYTTSNISENHLSPFDISYTTTLANSSVFLEYKVPYEASIQADQRISFIIKKSVNQQPETIIQTDGNLGPKNATGGMRNIYISNLFETNKGSVGDIIVYKLYSQLESNVTALDPLTDYATVRKAGVTFDTSGNYGSYMFKEFAN